LKVCEDLIIPNIDGTAPRLIFLNSIVPSNDGTAPRLIFLNSIVPSNDGTAPRLKYYIIRVIFSGFKYGMIRVIYYQFETWNDNGYPNRSAVKVLYNKGHLFRGLSME
jgi:hypothetical protein